MTALCAACAPKWLAWLDYRLTSPIRIHTIGEDNMRAQRDRRQARFEQWKDTILFQQQLITDACRNKHTAPAPPVHQHTQFDLFNPAVAA